MYTKRPELGLQERRIHLPGLQILESAQIARLTAEDKRGSYNVWLKCSRYGGGHDHLDALSIGVHACGEIITTDIGSPGYGLTAIRPFYKSTLSHNTLMVDDKPQEKVGDAELLLESHNELEVGGVVRDAYAGVVLSRKVRLAPPFVFLEDSFESDEDHRFALILHACGSMSAAVSGECDPTYLQPIPENEGPFAQFTHRETRWTDGFFRADWRITEFLWLRALVTTDGPMECTSGRTPGNPLNDDRGTVYIRRRAHHCTFRSVLEIHSGWPMKNRLHFDAERQS